MKKLILQFIKFGMVGLVNTAVSWAIYNGLLYLNVHYLLAFTAGFIVSVLVAYTLQKKFVFKGERKTEQLIKTYLAYFMTFLLNSAVLYICVEWLNISEEIAFFVPMVITIPTNFLMNKLWVNKEAFVDE